MRKLFLILTFTLTSYSYSFILICMMANRVGVSGTRWGTSICVEFFDNSNHSPMCNTKWPVHKGDILTFPESRWQARRWMQQSSVVLRGVEPSIQSSVHAHVFNVVGIPSVHNGSCICTSWGSPLEFDDVGVERWLVG